MLAAMPAFYGLVADDIGNYWVKEYVAPHWPTRNIWTVFDSTGRELGAVEFPFHGRVLQVQNELVVVHATDTNATDLILVYRLRK
jgi:hypothetical protein